MKKIDLKIVDTGKTRFLATKSTSDEFILLSYLVGDHRGKYAIQNVIDILEKAQRGEIVWEDFIQKYGGSWDFGYGAGELDIEDGTAYLVSDNEQEHKSMALPLQELIDIFKEWHALWVKHDK